MTEKVEVSFFDPNTGALVGRTFSGPAHWLAANTPPGCVAVRGIHDHKSYRVNVKTRKVEDWQPPQPSVDHQWDEQTRRWRLNAVASAREGRHQNALARIGQLEASQLRALREAALGDPEAIQRLRKIDAEIAALRSDLKGGG